MAADFLAPLIWFGGVFTLSFQPFLAPLLWLSTLTCCAWNVRRCWNHGSEDSVGWPPTDSGYLVALHHFSVIVQAAYVNSVAKMFARVPYLQPSSLLGFFPHTGQVSPEDATKCPPYFMYLDHGRKEVIICIRGIRLYVASDYWTLLANRKGSQTFLGGYVHRGIYHAALFLVERERETLRKTLEENRGYSLVFVGHSLGAGIAATASLLLTDGSRQFQGRDVQCIAFAPPRMASLDLAVKHADLISSVVLQDDFWPRASTSVIAKFFICALFGFWAVLSWRMFKDIFVTEKRRLKDKRRLYPPGKLHHLVCKQPRRLKKFQFEARVASPDGPRFEKVVLTWRAMTDHHIRSYESALAETIRSSQKAKTRMPNDSIPVTTTVGESTRDSAAAATKSDTKVVPESLCGTTKTAANEKDVVIDVVGQSDRENQYPSAPKDVTLIV